MNWKAILAATVMGLAATPLYAGHHVYAEPKALFYDKARVVDVEPIMRVVRVPTEHRECWNEEVEDYGYRTDPTAATVIGGIVGGVVGHGVVNGHGRTAATVAGTLVGAALGNSIGRDSYRPHTATERRCRVSNDYYEEERISGYRVTYRYHGHHYVRRMDHDPGPYVRVRVRVVPAED
jgi:uncharacterized protein YcfJ